MSTHFTKPTVLIIAAVTCFCVMFETGCSSKEDRANKLANNPKDIKAPGTLKKLRRQIRAIKKLQS